ncbi:uncharacterized protein FIBRA_06431 [Fibroporia radiculosa]|uniref:F-box domain-containing protein n=1 Tax=Fibroporia radiculosa TaxID=599839 RepID=J4HZ36_9APHY|nr:uncharacterized protein FIBRA_06431 [Fibroporia radiculosa]CCM04262.1 predicted protein [Fibroporia radiculosa]
MHHALLTPDIIVLIVAQFLPTEGQFTDYCSLAALARTSHAFHEAALNALWHTQIGIVNLIKCMPLDLWEEIMSGLKFVRPVVPNDWERFDYYAYRVRSVLAYRAISSPERERMISPVRLLDDVYIAIRQCRPSAPLLPNVQTLSWSRLFHVTSFPFIEMFYGPQLSSLTLLSFDISCAETLPLIARIPKLLPELCKLSLHLWPGIGRDVGGRPNSFAVPPGTLSALRNLRELTLYSDLPIPYYLEMFRYEAILNSREFVLPGPLILPPPGLINLQLLSHTLSPCKSILELSHYSSLRYISVTASHDIPKLIGLFFRALHDHCSHTALQELHITVGRIAINATDSRPELTSESASFHWLYVFSSLQRLVVHLAPNVHLNDRDLEDMAAAWPEIRELSFNREVIIVPPFSPAITWNGVVSLARHCHNLQTLGIDFNVSGSNVPQGDFSSDVIPNRTVTTLILGHSSLGGDPREAVAAVLGLFPNLENVEILLVLSSNFWIRVAFVAFKLVRVG